MQTLRHAGERAIIRRLQRVLRPGIGVIAGIGDDCAVVRSSSDKRYDLVLTSDPVIEGVHFLPSASPAAVGRKAAGRVLSDLAAMGAEPLWSLVDLVAPARTPVKRLEAVYRGLEAMSAKHGLAIVGGDTAQGPRLELHVFAMGSVPRGTAVLRSGARVGDVIFVTGSLGGSRSGWHLAFEPRMKEGNWLRQCGWATAMIDVSDGLASDLRRLAEMSGTGAVLDADAIPVSTAALRAGGSAIDHALFDGEDFELLFTVSPRRAGAFLAAWRRKFRLGVSCIGVMTAGPCGVVRCAFHGGRATVLKDGGYEHFTGHNARA